MEQCECRWYRGARFTWGRAGDFKMSRRPVAPASALCTRDKRVACGRECDARKTVLVVCQESSSCISLKHARHVRKTRGGSGRREKDAGTAGPCLLQMMESLLGGVKRTGWT